MEAPTHDLPHSLTITQTDTIVIISPQSDWQIEAKILITNLPIIIQNTT
jgi:hypothetical protein